MSVEYATAQGWVHALKDVSFSVEKGEIFGIVGESGSGKSTLAIALLNLLPENAEISGEILFEGENIFSLSGGALRVLRGRKLSMVFQAPVSSFNPVLSIEYQFREILKEKANLIQRDALKQRMVELFEKVRLPEPERILKSYPHQLSGGQLQRVALAFALSADPKVLIADEPTSSLDVTVESQIINLLLVLKEEFNVTIIFITHNLDLVNVLCERVCVLFKGEVRELKSKDELFHNPSDEYTKELLKSLKELQ